MKKTCTKCGKTRLIKFFGDHPWCKTCVCEKSKEYYTENKEKVNHYKKKYRSEHKEEIKLSKRDYYSKNPEYSTVRSHYWNIKKSKEPQHSNYKGMPFYPAWSPIDGGSIKKGADWIAKNLGHRPKGCTLHIIEHEKGFVPGNLEWTYPRQQSSRQMFKIITEQKHHIKKLESIINKLKQKLSNHA